MTLEGSSFFTLPCTKSVSIDQLIIRIDQQQAVHSQTPRAGVRHLYALRDNKVVELTDTMDLHALFAKQNNPVILVSAHNDEALPSRLLFSLSTPGGFRPRRR